MADLVPVAGTWPAVGMAASDTLDVRFAGIPAEPLGGPGSYINRPGFAHGGAGVAACWYSGARGSAGRCWPPQPRVTSDRTRWLISARWTSRFIPPGRRSTRPPRRLTRIRRIATTAASCVPCGCALWWKLCPPRSFSGWAGRWGGAAVSRRGAFAPGGGPDRVSAPASRRAQPGRARRARGPQRCLVASGLWPNRYIRADTTPVSVAQATGLV